MIKRKYANVDVCAVFSLFVSQSSMARTKGFQLRFDPSKPRPDHAAVAAEYRKFIANMVLQRTAMAERNKAAKAARNAAATEALSSNTKVTARAFATGIAATAQPLRPARRSAAAASGLACNAAAKIKKAVAKKAALRKPAAKAANPAAYRKDDGKPNKSVAKTRAIKKQSAAKKVRPLPYPAAIAA